jgi:Asp-tRNA(Asn)/Glu-tRNA(Gln) amidotransferase A subunit family amidase
MLRRLDGAWLLGQCLEFPLDPLPLPCRRLQTLPNSPAPKVLPFVAAWCRRAEKLTAANALRALGQVFLMREKAVASMSKFDFLISPTSPITAYAVDEATSGNDDWKPILRYRMSSTKSKRAARPSGASVIRIARSRRNKPSRRLAGSSGK